jgi:protein involved in polysaccharide export with SLBB domain
MKSPLFHMPRTLFLILPLLTLFLAGCASTDNSAVMNPPAADYAGDPAVARLHVGDTITVLLDGLPEAISPHEESIKEDGSINLDLIGHVKAAGRTAGELQDAIHELYVPRFYTHVTVTVKTGDRVFYVRGEIKAPGRQIYVGQITVTKAITSSGDFTDFANRKKVWLIRANGQRFNLNCNAILDGEAPDPQVYPGDQIVVTRRAF